MEGEMPRIPRLLNEGEATVYHVMSRTALDGFPLGDIEKDYLLNIIKKFAGLYFVDMLGFALMGNHFHLLVRMHPNAGYTDKGIQERVNCFYDGDKTIHISDVEKYRHKLGSLSEFVKDIKQSFTRWFNKENKRKGFFWGQRFKSVIVENGDTLVNCLAYIDLNPVRANIVEKPEDYRWNTLGYLLQTNNKDQFLSLEFGLPAEETLSFSEKLQNYRQFVYETGALPTEKGKSLNEHLVETERQKGFQVTRMERFKYRTRYFTDSGVIGSKQFVRENYQRFKGYFECKHDKVPVSVKGLDGLYSLKRLASNII
jgi:REP element-mobilizing transposase RayT